MRIPAPRTFGLDYFLLRCLKLDTAILTLQCDRNEIDIQARSLSQSPETDLGKVELHPIANHVTHLADLKLNSDDALDLLVGDAARVMECYL